MARKPKSLTVKPPAHSVNQELTQFRNLTKRELIHIGNLVVKGSYTQLNELAESKQATVLHLMLASVCNYIINTGNMITLDKLLDRLIGKVRDEIKLETEAVNPPQVIVTLPSNGREVRTLQPNTEPAFIDEDYDLGF